jgi:uridylate kinase
MTHRTVFLKLSGEQLSGDSKCGIDSQAVCRVAAELAIANTVARESDIHGMVFKTGGGNLFRGRNSLESRSGDSIGRLATVMNTIAISEELENQCVPNVMLLAPTMRIEDSHAFHEFKPYSVELMEQSFRNGLVVLSAAGMGENNRTSDYSIASMAGQYNQYCQQGDVADLDTTILKGTQVDAVYEEDPHINPKARAYRVLSAHTIRDNPDTLGVIDTSTPDQLINYGLSMLVYDGAITAASVLRELSADRDLVDQTVGTLIVPYDTEPVFYG